MSDMDLIERVLRVTAFEYCDDIWWRLGENEMVNGKMTLVRADELRVLAKCSDFFDYACADCEEITAENIALFESTYRECKDLFGEYNATYAVELFVARVRNRQPMQSVMDGFRENSPRLAELFEPLGPNSTGEIL